MDADRFRAGMRRLAAGVSIVTAKGAGGPAGATVTSVTSLCAAPQSLLVCLNRAVSIHAVVEASSCFGINVLRSVHADIAGRFADPAARERRFATGDWAMDDVAPYLRDAQVSFMCDLDQMIPFGTHSICIGRIREIRVRDDVDPLLYVDGTMSQVAAPGHPAI